MYQQHRLQLQPQCLFKDLGPSVAEAASLRQDSGLQYDIDTARMAALMLYLLAGQACSHVHNLVYREHHE